MVLVPTNQIPLGFKAPDFTLYNPLTGKQESLQKHKSDKATVIVFICNHCPYVLHIIDKLADIAREYKQKGVSFIAINPNDVENYPQDRPEKMVEMAKEKDFVFPYLYDETQEVAKAYDAACTPDFNVFDSDMRCVYRGQFDESRPGNNKPVTGKDLKHALDLLLEGKDIPEDQIPSSGCSIKWKET
ncbi:MAG: thioredoxin family protein [Bacteroidales bacterium]|nr:thioredoxin family protein [Bacteroidales bacterium]MCF8327762.1 thioredoxin family protein [Bacteroidales bacterium]